MTETQPKYSTADKWPQVLAALETSLTKAQFNAHFSGSKAIIEKDGSVTVSLPPSANLQQIKHRLAHIVKRCVKPIYGDVGINYQPSLIDNGPASRDLETLPSSPAQTTFKTDGFTPVIDSLAADLGLVSSAIYGVVWRYCQMNSRTCYATQAKIASRLGVDRKTVNRQIKPLLKDGYVRCLNGKENGVTKVYIVTNKLSIETGFVMKATKK